MGWQAVKNVLVTVRAKTGYVSVKRVVYHKPGFGTYIHYKGKVWVVSLTRHDNSAYTLFNEGQVYFGTKRGK